MAIIIISILSVVVVINILLVVFWHFQFKEYKSFHKSNLKVSVLVAARNEEETIAGCIKSLTEQSYEHMEIIVGDDSSTDNTVAEVQKFKGVKLIQVKENIGLAHGKANVLAHLARHAEGDIFLITDADIRPQQDWVKSMLDYLGPSVGIVNGVTAVLNNRFQHYEWLYFQGMIKVITDLFRPVTAVGNNMLITREAYESTGGYENIPFSITEDYALFHEVRKQGFKLRQAVSPGVLAYTLPAKGLGSILHQRKRWMSGAFQLPWWIILILFFQGIYFPAVAVGLVVFPEWTLVLFIFKFFFQSIFIKSISGKVGLSLKGGLLLYDIYAGIISILMMVFYLIPVKVKWKGRTY